MSRYDWMENARCAQVDPGLFHSDSGSNYGDAKQICARCPVRRQCEAHVAQLDTEGGPYGKHGVWAGQTKKDREARRRDTERAERNAVILRLLERGGMEPQEVAAHVGVSERTVWRVQRAHRERMEKAA